MSETITMTIDGHYVSFTIPQPHPNVFQPRNLKFRFKEGMTIEMKSPNWEGYIPYPTDFQMVLVEPELPNPMYFLETRNNFLLGNAKLCYAPYVTTFQYTNWEGCVHETALRNVINEQQQPVVIPWNPNGHLSGASTSSNEISPPPIVSPMGDSDEDSHHISVFSDEDDDADEPLNGRE